jgi:hypothetical protein
MDGKCRTKATVRRNNIRQATDYCCPHLESGNAIALELLPNAPGMHNLPDMEKMRLARTHLPRRPDSI